jgi:hypothetical protein
VALPSPPATEPQYSRVRRFGSPDAMVSGSPIQRTWDFNVLDYGVLVGRILVVPNLASGKQGG